MLDERVLPAAIPLVAIALDLLLGDPPRFPHPVRGLGLLAQGMERLFRPQSASPRLQRAMGLSCTVLLMLLAASAAGAAVVFLPLGGFVALYLAYAGLALGQLRREARRVLKFTREQDGLSRTALRMLVSRDTEHLTLPQVRRTLAETVSENTSDGFVAPFFYLALLGPPGLWAYKAASTLDSMWGYKTPRYLHFGWGAARMDDLLNLLPARLTAVCILLVAWARGFLGGRSPARLKRAWQYTVRDARKTSSPNAGWPMAAAAWGLGAGMGGPARYFGQEQMKPWLGPAEGDGLEPRQWTQQRCEALVEVCTAACLTAAVALHLIVLGLLWLGISWLGYFTG
ncbi:adenosylcobinamide-phosphate synthase CbiB [Megalodesulfovibrio gigas]|uniref:Cobalamin biosynthesis protein CobD n=1 Tax=Megalodesulfovibrio gigas (strain ATCC 19364 / DSM 1382 / NCIMB 9332 / VKM B-1759) TaxID=1121448 RepID=T2GEJ2_MEGG1|nr:adenosylcobinamide-phosphate synthase CbiB [Megalodesulfovibrio gigas]AGW14698.1 putative cobalamin biosynthesis protein CobD [Megalodesulfovibrio gigas DSM 1382 = ATCC 19364]